MDFSSRSPSPMRSRRWYLIPSLDFRSSHSKSRDSLISRYFFRWNILSISLRPSIRLVTKKPRRGDQICMLFERPPPGRTSSVMNPRECNTRTASNSRSESPVTSIASNSCSCERRGSRVLSRMASLNLCTGEIRSRRQGVRSC